MNPQFHSSNKVRMQVKDKLTHTVRFSAASNVKTAFKAYYADVYKHGKYSAHRANKLLKSAPLANMCMCAAPLESSQGSAAAAAAAAMCVRPPPHALAMWIQQPFALFPVSMQSEPALACAPCMHCFRPVG